MRNLLEINQLTKVFGGVTAVDHVSFQVAEGQIVAVIGPNGAGKTTLFNMISCFIPPSSGEVLFKGKVLTGKKIHELAALGISRTFQNLQIFKNMTVLENIMMGAHVRMGTTVLKAGFRLPIVRRDELLAYELACDALKRGGLEALSQEKAGTLSYGQQKQLEFARAVLYDPALVLLDEPMAGLNDAETYNMSRLIVDYKEKGHSFLFVEHKMNTVMRIADRINVIDFGKKIAEGTPEEIQRNDKVIEAYLGEGIVHA